jgi:putative tricarboxylic transport membrane protein
MKFLEKFIMAIMSAIAMFFANATIQSARAESTWQPTKPIEFVIPVGCCVGGANDMARTIKSIIEKHNLVTQPILIINKPTGPASEGYVYVKNQSGNPHVISIAITSIFTQGLANPQAGFTYTDVTPLAMMALDDFALWVPADAPYRNSQDFIKQAKTQPGVISIGGLSVKQEDQIVVVAMEQAKSVSFNYVPFKAGGDIAIQLAGKNIDASVNNPSEGIQLWQAGKIKPLCVFDSKRMPNKDFVTSTQSWNSIPTCREQNLDVQYKMMRAIVAPPGISQEVTAYYQSVLEKVSATPEWQQYTKLNALEPQYMKGDKFVKWLEQSYQQHRDIMLRSGLMSK